MASTSAVASARAGEKDSGATRPPWPRLLVEKWKYKLFGPTIIHLQHEAYLLVSLALLMVASFQSLYRETFGLVGDFQFCVLAILWLSRHVLVRWICTWDDHSSHRRPTIRGVLAHWITSHIMAGQYFDRPSYSVLTKLGIGPPRGAEEEGRAASHSTFLLPSLRYTVHFFRVSLWFPLLRLQEWIEDKLDILSGGDSISADSTSSSGGNPHYQHSSGSNRRQRDNNPPSHMSPFLSSSYHYWNKAWITCGPYLHMSIPVVALLYYTWTLPVPVMDLLVPSRNLPATDNAQESSATIQAFGAYTRFERPEWLDVLYYLSIPTVASLLLYSRLIVPIPDLVAGNNVLKDVRNEAKAYGGHGSKSSKAKLQKENQDAPWAEQNRSIVSQNRFRLINTVATLRIMEHIFICNLIPLTDYACRVTGHCPDGVQLWQLSRVLYPAGTRGPLRDDADFSNAFSLIQPDRVSALVAFLSVLVVSGILLLAQAITLNGSYLAVMGYITGEWTLVDPKKDPAVTSSGVGPSQWDPRRRYKKGDLIVHNQSGLFAGQAIFKATSNSPEGRPFDLYLRATHDLFRNELGHPSTSNLLARAIEGHLVFIAVLVAMVSWRFVVVGGHTAGLFVALLANLVACHGAINVGMTSNSELRRLSQEIS